MTQQNPLDNLKLDELKLKDIKLVIFDHDGVILDIVESVRKATIDAVNKFKEITAEPDEILEELAHLIEKIQTIPIPKMVLQANELFNVSFVGDITILKKLEIGAFIYTRFKEDLKTAKIYDGIGELIRYLAKKGKKLAVLTNNKKSYAMETLNRLNVMKFFNEKSIIGYNEVKKIKPDPEGLLKIMELNGIKNHDEAIFIGDMTSDAKAGRNANIRTICVYSGLSKKQALKNEKPFMFANSTEELAQIFGLPS